MAQAIGAVVSFFSTVFWKTTAFAVGAGASATIGVIVGALAVGAVIAGGVALMKTLAPKMPDLNAIDIEGAIEMVKGSAVSMGMEVVN